MQQERANNTDSVGLLGWWLVVVDTNINQEEQRNKNLDSKYDKTLFQCESLLERGAALGHVGADGVVVHVSGELEFLVLFIVLLTHNDFVLHAGVSHNVFIFILTGAAGVIARITSDIVLFSLPVLSIDLSSKLTNFSLWLLDCFLFLFFWLLTSFKHHACHSLNFLLRHCFFFILIPVEVIFPVFVLLLRVFSSVLQLFLLNLIQCEHVFDNFS